MKVSRQLLPRLTGLAPLVSGAIHTLFVGNLRPPASIYALEFDDETHDFKLAKNNSADAPHGWITFDVQENIYGASADEARIASYRVAGPATIELTKSISATGTGTGTGAGACFNTTSAFVEAMSTEPYFAFVASRSGPGSCGMVLSVDSTGALAEVADSWTYANDSRVLGLALGEQAGKQLVYSADLEGNIVWTHRVDRTSGSVSEVDRLPAPYPGMRPRHLAAHPGGKYLYVVMEADNSIAQFDLDSETGAPLKESLRVMLIPIDADTTLYWSAAVTLSPSARYLWATAQARNQTETGFISAFLLGDDGHIVRRMFRVPTARGGGANAVSPAFWSDEYAAVTSHNQGYVEIWKMDGPRDTRDGTEYTAARAVAKVEIADGGCCANAIWYS